MSHWRSEYRAIVRSALTADPRLGAVTQLSAWAENIDIATLPVIGVVTPSESVGIPARGQSERGTLLQVVLKRRGGEDLEEQLDEDAEAIEACVVSALRSNQIQCIPEELSLPIAGDGQMRVGTVVINFRVTSWRSFGSN